MALTNEEKSQLREWELNNNIDKAKDAEEAIKKGDEPNETGKRNQDRLLA